MRTISASNASRSAPSAGTSKRDLSKSARSGAIRVASATRYVSLVIGRKKHSSDSVSCHDSCAPVSLRVLRSLSVSVNVTCCAASALSIPSARSNAGIGGRSMIFVPPKTGMTATSISSQSIDLPGVGMPSSSVGNVARSSPQSAGLCNCGHAVQTEMDACPVLVVVAEAIGLTLWLPSRSERSMLRDDGGTRRGPQRPGSARLARSRPNQDCSR